MSVTPQDLQDCAASLEIESESAVRACISRHYYAAYHRAFAYHNDLDKPGFSLPPGNRGGVHEQLIHQLTNPALSRGDEFLKSKAIGYLLRVLKLKRVDADYNLASTLDTRFATQVREEVNLIFAKSDLPPNSKARPQ